MTFDEFMRLEWPAFSGGTEFWLDDMRQCWEAAQRETAKRCAEIWHLNPTDEFLSALSREFGLDK